MNGEEFATRHCSCRGAPQKSSKEKIRGRVGCGRELVLGMTPAFFPNQGPYEPAEISARREQPRSLLDAVHGQPAVQGESAPAGQGRGHALLDARGPPDPRRHRGAVVRQRRPWPARRSRQAIASSSTRWTTRRRSRWGTRKRSSWPARWRRCCRATSTTCSSRNSGSESVDTALKIALAYHRARGEGTRTRFIGRERGYHGVGFGGISVGGMVNNRKMVRRAAAGRRSPAAHPRPGAERLLAGRAGARRASRRRARAASSALHDASNIAAVIVEPMRRLDRRPAAAQGLPQAPARDLRQARHPADLRRGHHRLRPPRRLVRRRGVRRHRPT